MNLYSCTTERGKKRTNKPNKNKTFVVNKSWKKWNDLFLRSLSLKMLIFIVTYWGEILESNYGVNDTEMRTKKHAE